MVGNFGFDDGNIVLDVTGMLLDIFVCIYIYICIDIDIHT